MIKLRYCDITGGSDIATEQEHSLAMSIVHEASSFSRYKQGRIKGGATGAIAPGPPLQGAPRDEIYLFQIKYSVEKFS